MATVWVTKYVLQHGLLEWQAESQTGMDACWAKGKRDPAKSTTSELLLRGEWYLEKSAALARAREIVGDEIDALDRRMRELEAMTFGAEE